MRKHLTLCLVALGLLALPALAQEQMGRIEGRVTTEEGMAIVGAQVVISSDSLVAGSLETTTDDRGRFRFPILPIGIYGINISAEQYQTFEQSNIVVSIGATVTLSPVLQVGTFEQVITITGEAPLIDVTSTDMSEILSQEIISRLPVPRFPTEMMSYAPGNVGGDFGSTLGGAEYSANAYQLDGIDVSDPQTGTTWVFVNIESLAEMEVLPIAGATADVGNFTGAAINMVTKSGGNEFSGGFAYYYFDDSLITWNTDDEDLQNSTSRYALNNDFTAFLGGPIVKDRLWFFFNVGLRKEGNLRRETLNTQKYRNSMFKLSFVPRDDMNLWFMYHYDNYLVDGRFADYNAADEATADQDGPNHSFAVHYAWVIDNDNLFEAKFHGWDGRFGYVGKGSGSYIYDVVDDWAFGNSPYEYMAWRDRYELSTIFTHYRNDFYGDHEFKLGFDYRRGSSEENFHMDWVYQAAGENFLRFGYYPDDYALTETKGWDLYIMDGWNITDRLLLNVGLRIDRPTHHIPDQVRSDGSQVNGPGDIHTFTNIAPRIGFTYKLTEDGRNILRGSWGRYYEAVQTGLLSNMNPGASPWIEYFWDGASWVEYYREEIGQIYSVDPDLSGMYTEAFTLGFEREISTNMAVGIDYVHRQSKNIVVKAEVGNTYAPYTFSYEGTPYTVFSRTAADPSYIIQNAPNDELYSRYDGVILSFAKRYSDNWSLRASLTLSHLRGTAEDSPQESFGTYGETNGDLNLYADPNNRINWDGALNRHRPINLKVVGIYTLPYDISVSGFATYASGTVWTPVLYYEDDNLGQFDVEFMTEERGSRRLDPVFQLDMRVEKQFLFGRYGVSFLVDFYNVFNTGTINDVVRNIDLDDFDTPNSVMDPRVIQLGLRFTF